MVDVVAHRASNGPADWSAPPRGRHHRRVLATTAAQWLSTHARTQIPTTIAMPMKPIMASAANTVTPETVVDRAVCRAGSAPQKN